MQTTTTDIPEKNSSSVEHNAYIAPAFDVVDMIDTIGISKGSYGDRVAAME